MTDFNPEETYYTRLTQLSQSLHHLNKRKRSLALLRLISFLAAITALWIFFPHGWYITTGVFLILIGFFFYFVAKDLANGNAIENTLLLISINKKELAALNHQFIDFPDGSAWKPTLHEYANDLDIFGQASLYQYINRTTSQQGNKLLSEWLLKPAGKAEIEQRQAAAKELSVQTEWRQQLQAFGISNYLTIQTQKNIEHWLSEDSQFIKKKSWNLLRLVFPILSFGVLCLYISNIITQKQFLPIMMVFLAISFWVSKLIMPLYTKLNKITTELDTLSSSIRWIEGKSFESPLLQQLKGNFDSTGNKASQNINNLKKILDRLDYRLNPLVFIPLNTFLCWDLQQVFALEKWKAKNRQKNADWFSSLAEMEALSSLATLSFNHPGWCFPEIVPEEAIFKTEFMGHPLIPKEKRINNSFSTVGVNQISLITGSNMAGKSTFLRSTGINIVLAMMGAPVCAKSLSLSPTKVMSSMRISDNLEESTSTFYAELKKLKEIIEAVYRNEKVFLLLDEILRGTNSADRFTGSSALLKQLIQHKVAGMVATHDLKLTKLADEFPHNIHNYHFDVQVDGDELFFDYKLKRGICQSMNASILMKKIGIDL